MTITTAPMVDGITGKVLISAGSVVNPTNHYSDGFVTIVYQGIEYLVHPGMLAVVDD